MVAVRDSIDRELNLVFYRSRDNCQTLTEEDPNLALTGPTRAVVFGGGGDVIVEVDLKVRGNIESEDRYLSLVAAPLQNPTARYMSKCGCVVFSHKVIPQSVEATVFIQITEGSWPDGVYGEIAARSSHDLEKVVLLRFGADKVPVSGGGNLELSRHVVSIYYAAQLFICFNAWQDGRILLNHYANFKAAAAGRNRATLQLGTCTLEVIVAWSLVSPEPDVATMWA